MNLLQIHEPGEMILAARRLDGAAGMAEQGHRSHGAVAGPTGDDAVVRFHRHIHRRSAGVSAAKSACQTWKDSPQPQRPFSFGLRKTKPDWSFSST